MSRYAAYIDESGNHDLATEKNGASKYFLILAIVVEQANVPALTAVIEAIKRGNPPTKRARLEVEFST